VSKPPTEAKILPLHAHTAYSLLDGVSQVSEYIDYCKNNGLEACSCTDHGYVMGLYDLINQSASANIKGIPGLEAYLHPGKDYIKAPHQKKVPNYFHITLWASNHTGYKNLLELSNCSWMDDRPISVFGMKPRVTWEDLDTFKDGLICGSGCIIGPVVFPFLRGERDMANENIHKLIDIFGDKLFLEIMPHRVDKDWLSKDIIQVDAISSNITYTFHKDDIIQTEQGELTVEQAMKNGAMEILSSVTRRPQPHSFSTRSIKI